MALTINTNISSLIAQRSLTAATDGMNLSLERMSTGYKINHAKDNAAGYSIANSWETKLGSLDVAADNAATGLDLLTTAEETYGLLTSHLQRVRDLTEQAANGTYGSQSLKAIQAEVVARLQEIKEEIEKKDYLFKNAISEVIYRQEDDSFEIKFLDGLGGMSSVEMFNKIVGIKKTENGFSATILRVDFDQAAHSTDPNSIFESSNGTTKLYNMLLSDEDKNTIKESLSAYEFRFIDEEGGYKLSSIQKIQ